MYYKNGRRIPVVKVAYRGRTTRYMKRMIGLKHSGPSVDPNQVYRVVYAVEGHTLIATPATESTAAESLAMGVDFLANIRASPNWAQAVANRFGSIRIKGFSLTRTILSLNTTNPITDPEAAFLNFVWRCDDDIPYGALTGMSASTILT